MINITDLTIKYRQTLFNDLSCKLTTGDKVGLVGLNGCGKSTLLKVIMGLEEPDKGNVDIGKERIAYLPQEFNLPEQLVGEFLEELVADPYSEMHKVSRVLSKLDFDDVDIFQEINTLSYGQKMKLYLTKLMMSEPTVLLLDEPTNYLDLPGIMWVEEFIQNFNGICVIVSHDRAFLNNVVNKIFEIDEQKLYEFVGNYEEYLEQKEGLIGQRAIQYKQQERHRQKLEARIVLIKKFSSGAKQGRALKAARTRLEREVTSKEISDYKEQKIAGLKLAGTTHQTKQILKIADLTFGYGSEKLIEKANFNLYGKGKVWFWGANGIGKSTLIKLIVGELKPDAGEAKIGDNLKWRYFSQDQSHLDPTATVQNYFMKHAGVDYSQSFGILQKFLFSKEMMSAQLKQLSPGQRARLSFAVFAQQELDFLILDEPTNHLDIKSKEIIEEAFRNYKGAMLLISHDRYFVESIGIDRTITLEDKQIVEI